MIPGVLASIYIYDLLSGSQPVIVSAPFYYLAILPEGVQLEYFRDNFKVISYSVYDFHTCQFYFLEM